MELFQASQQWAKRPDDQRFESIDALYQATKAYYKAKVERPDVPYSTLRTEAQGSEIMLVGKGGIPARMTHWSFGNLARRVNAPADYLRSIPATLAAQNINHGLKQLSEHSGNANILFHVQDKDKQIFICRSISSDRYNRFWNYEIAERLLDSTQQGWRVPPARPAREGQSGTRRAAQSDVLDIGGGGGLSVRVGDLIAPAGIYASDHDMFVFLINQNNRVNDGTEGGLSRGMFVRNSEVSGASKFGICRFLFRHVCGNHIVWGASEYEEIAFRHVGHKLHDKIREAFEVSLVKYSNESGSDQELQIKAAKKKLLGATKEEVLDYLFGKRLCSRKLAETAYDAVIPEQDGDAKSIWGMTQGMTRTSQLNPFADERVNMDNAAAKILALAF